jgi:hypothetical protein
MKTFYKGKISDVKIYDTYFSDINEMESNTENLVMDFNDVNEKLINNNVTFTNEDIEIIENIVPYRKQGMFYCLPHQDEGFINGKWAKGETTARNEKRFVTEMQQKKINYKEEGLNKITEVTEIVELDEKLYPNTMFINCKMK